MSAQNQLEELNKKIKDCHRCSLRAGCRQVVPGEGSVQAEIMFIGEGPGQKEDELGRPFVGAAGKFLEEMLGSLNLRREDVFIANVVKCRPPQNRDPLPEEKETCWPWLLAQIKLICPKLIVTLGRHSLEAFLPNFKISKIHGQALRKEIPEVGKQVFFALYHPAAALYNGSMRAVLLKDFKKIPKVLSAADKKETEGENKIQEIEKKKEQESLF